MSFDLTTFLFELVNFVVLTWLLYRILYKPLKRGIQERRDRLAAREGEAERLAEEAREALVAQQERQRELELLRESIVQDAAEQASEERARILTQAREDAAAERARAERMLEAERESALNWVREVAVEQSTALAGRMLVKLAPEAAHGALMERAGEALEAHREAIREAALEGAGPEAEGVVEVDLHLARVPGSEELDALRATLEGLIGARVRLAIHEDEGLMAGLVVHVGDRVFDASVAGQLAALRRDARQMLERAHG